MNSISRSKSKMQTESSRIFKWLFVFMVSIFITEQISAQVSPRIRTTSNLKDANGAAVNDGVYTIIFRLYYEESGGTVLWSEVAPVNVKGGVYTHLLGSITSLSNINFNFKLFLGMQIGDFELTPRTELTYAPYAVAAQQVVCSGAVGDIKYSLLNPTQFALVNGDCWVPMDGGDISNSKLDVTFGIASAPDGSGLFIRSQEFVSSPTTNDPDRTTSSPIATLQSDEVLAHGHTINYGGSHSHGYTDKEQQLTSGNYYALVNNGSFPVAGDQYTDLQRTSSSNTTGISISNNAGPETRPINMNVWAYIRIN